MAWRSEIQRRIYDKMMKHLQIGSANSITRASEWLYEVDDNYRTYIVDLEHHVYKDSWPNFDGDGILPLLVKRPPTRPRLTRRREADETPPERGRYMM
ncbi:hypothetical protein WN944_015441 [Citrus x changshan-huyou]|uniref:Uncharacterized protein n=1 Tax=Citrus x changshan-huyou TaxID=2935761 RepID=A0AAP0M7M9_9ROSI